MECGCLFLALIVLLLPAIIMQGYGCFYERLLHTDECGDIGLLTYCYFDHTNKTTIEYFASRRISETAVVLQIIAFAALLDCAGILIKMMRHSNDGDDDDEGGDVKLGCMYCLAALLYPASGILCVVGCWLVASSDIRPENSVLGSAFYCSLVAGIYIIVQIMCLICLVMFIGCCFEDTEDENEPSPSAENNSQLSPGVSEFSSGAVATTEESGRGALTEVDTAQVAEQRKSGNKSNALRTLHVACT